MYPSTDYEISCALARSIGFLLLVPASGKEVISFSRCVPCASFPLSFLPSLLHVILLADVLFPASSVFSIPSLENVREKRSRRVCRAQRSKSNKHLWFTMIPNRRARAPLRWNPQSVIPDRVSVNTRFIEGPFFSFYIPSDRCSCDFNRRNTTRVTGTLRRKRESS